MCLPFFRPCARAGRRFIGRRMLTFTVSTRPVTGMLRRAKCASLVSLQGPGQAAEKVRSGSRYGIGEKIHVIFHEVQPSFVNILACKDVSIETSAECRL